MNNDCIKEKGKSDIRCLALRGDSSFAKENDALEMCGDYYKNAEFVGVKDCGHWIAEEQPGQFVDVILRWVDKS